MNPDHTPPGNLSADEDDLLQLVRDTGFNSNNQNTVAGPTSGIQTASGVPTNISWWTNPLDAVTISGTITFNIWMAENNMSANVGPQFILDRVDGAGAFISTIVNSERGVEVPVTTRAAQNWTASPTSTTLAAGDRIRCRVFANDVGTMASGFVWTWSSGGSSAGADGDSFVTFTETVTEQAVERVPFYRPYTQLLAH